MRISHIRHTTVGRDKRIIDESGEKGEFFGRVMQEYLKNQSCSCERNYVIDDANGTWFQDIVVGKHGSIISLTALNNHNDELNQVYNFQFFQYKLGDVTLRLNVDKNFTNEDEKRIIEAFKRKDGCELDPFIEKVNDIDVTSMGKPRFLIQKLNFRHW